MDACPWPFLFLYRPAACNSVINYSIVQNLVRAEHKINTGTQNGWREVTQGTRGDWFEDFNNPQKGSFSFHLGWTLCPTAPELYLFGWEVFTFSYHFVIRFISLDKKKNPRNSIHCPAHDFLNFLICHALKFAMNCPYCAFSSVLFLFLS